MIRLEDSICGVFNFQNVVELAEAGAIKIVVNKLAVPHSKSIENACMLLTKLCDHGMIQTKALSHLEFVHTFCLFVFVSEQLSLEQHSFCLQSAPNKREIVKEEGCTHLISLLSHEVKAVRKAAKETLKKISTNNCTLTNPNIPCLLRLRFTIGLLLHLL